MTAKPSFSELQVVSVNQLGPKVDVDWMITKTVLSRAPGRASSRAPQLQHTTLQLSPRTHNNSRRKLSYSHTALTPVYIIQSTVVTILGLKMIHSHIDWSIRYRQSGNFLGINKLTTQDKTLVGILHFKIFKYFTIFHETKITQRRFGIFYQIKHFVLKVPSGLKIYLMTHPKFQLPKCLYGKKY